MAIVDITLKDGTTYTLENVPDDMTDAQIMALAEKQRGKERAENYGGEKPGMLTEFAGGMKHAFDKAAYGLSDMLPDLPISQESRDAYNGHPLVKTLGLTLPSRKERAETLKDGSEFVKNTGAASSVGEFIGDVAPYVAGGAAMAGAKLVPSLGIQGLIGATVQPGGVGDKALNAGFSMAGEGLGQAAGAGAKYVMKGVEPFTQSGRARILRRTLEGAADDPANLLSKLDNAVELVPGVRPTTAQAVLDPGISQLADAAGSRFRPVASAFQHSRDARIGEYDRLMREIAGIDDTGKTYWPALKERAQSQLGADLKKAYDQPLTSTPELDAIRDSILQRPSVKSAKTRALRIMKEEGVTPPMDGSGSVKGLHYLKNSVDDAADNAFNAKGHKNEAFAIGGTRDLIKDYLRQASPLYDDAYWTFKQNMRPVNQMATGEQLYRKSFPAINDGGDPFRITPSNFANALRNGDAIAKEATKLNGATLDNIFTPEQMATYTGIRDDMARAIRSDELAKMAGSPTAQRLSGIADLEGSGNKLQTVLRGFGFMKAGPLGAAVADSVTDPFFSKATQSAGDMLAYALSDPRNAASVIRNTSLDPGLGQKMLVSPKGAWSAATTRLNPPSMQNLEEQ